MELLDKSHLGDETAESSLCSWISHPGAPRAGQGLFLVQKGEGGSQGAIDGERLPDLAAGRLLFVCFKDLQTTRGWDAHRIASNTQTSHLHPKWRTQSPRVAATIPSLPRGPSLLHRLVCVRSFRGQAAWLSSRSLPRPRESLIPSARTCNQLHFIFMV